MDPENKSESWGTTPNWLRKEYNSILLIIIPSISIEPVVGA